MNKIGILTPTKSTVGLAAGRTVLARASSVPGVGPVTRCRLAPLSLFVALLSAQVSLHAGRATQFAALPAGLVVTALKMDAAGGVYIAGTMPPLGPRSGSDTQDAFVAKISPDGSRLVYINIFGGSRNEQANALAVDAAGAAYLTGITTSPDFPVTPHTAPIAYPSSNVQLYAAKIDPVGKVLYATLFAGTAEGLGPSDIAVNSSGEAWITGSADAFTATAGGLSGGDAGTFLAKLNQTGEKLIVGIAGLGGKSVAVDPQGNVYVAGATTQASGIPTTADAFQRSLPAGACTDTCAHQYILKLDPSGQRILYGTFLTGRSGASPSAMEVDVQGNVLVAGMTGSPDYPVTAGALQTTFPTQTVPSSAGIISFLGSTGFVTKLNASGTALVFSTFFGGSNVDRLSSFVSAGDSIYLAGVTNSTDLPGLNDAVAACLPQSFVARIAADASVARSAYTLDLPPKAATIILTAIGNIRARAQSPTLVAVDSNGLPLVALPQVEALTKVDLAAISPPIACLADAADLTASAPVAPGQLVSVFGRRLATGEATAPQTGSLPTLLGGARVTFNGILAPLLYASPGQLNVQVPFEIPERGAITMEVSTATAEKDTLKLSAAPRVPSVFLNPTPRHCGNSFIPFLLVEGPAPLALNEDGSVNGCDNPAQPGSLVTIILNGVGRTEPAQTTGAIVTTAAPLNLSVTAPPGLILPGPVAEPVSATTLPNAISGLWEVKLRVPADAPGSTVVSLAVDSVPTREQLMTIWVRLKN